VTEISLVLSSFQSFFVFCEDIDSSLRSRPSTASLARTPVAAEFSTAASSRDTCRLRSHWNDDVDDETEDDVADHVADDVADHVADHVFGRPVFVGREFR
jgi:hypothetical protein